MQLIGELKGKTAFKEVMKSPTVYVTYGFKLDLLHNDVPVMLFYKHKNNPWRTILVNNQFSTDQVPHSSDVYLSASMDNKEKIIYSIDY